MYYGVNLPYRLFSIIVQTAFRANYRNLIYINTEYFPENTPIIYAPNHRNAVVDGLTLVKFSPRNKPIVFLARADFFNNKIVRFILNRFDIIPVYRIRDGVENLSKNNDIFEKCRDILEHGIPICLFPEGKHSPKQSLLPILKGIPRIALPAEASKYFKLGITILPITIFYSDIDGFLSDIYVSFCKPVKTSEYQQQYEQNPNLAINNMRHEIERNMQDEMVNVTNEDYYHFYEYCMDLCGKDIAKEKFGQDKGGLVKANRLITQKLDDLFTSDNPKFLEVVDNYGHIFSILKFNGLSTKDNIFHSETSFTLILMFIGLLLTLPITIYGFANLIFPIALYAIMRSKMKDKQFTSTERIVAGIFFVPIFALIQFIIFGCITHLWWWALVYMISITSAFYYGCYWRKWLKYAIRQIKVKKYIHRNKSDWEYLKKTADWKKWI